MVYLNTIIQFCFPQKQYKLISKEFFLSSCDILAKSIFERLQCISDIHFFLL